MKFVMYNICEYIIIDTYMQVYKQNCYVQSKCYIIELSLWARKKHYDFYVGNNFSVRIITTGNVSIVNFLMKFIQ